MKNYSACLISDIFPFGFRILRHNIKHRLPKRKRWLRAQHGVDEYLDGQERWSARRGSEIGVKYAEAFRQHRGHPYPYDNALLALLGERVKAAVS